MVMADKEYKDKPELVPQERIRKILMQPYERYLPTAFDESLSLLEKVNKVIWKLDKLGKLTNDMLDRWNEVLEWVMEDGLKQAVLDQLNEWLEDGTLKEIIEEEIFQELRDDVDKVQENLDKLQDNFDDLKEDVGDLEDEIDDKLDDKLDLKGYYNEHTVETHRDEESETTYKLMKIPKYDDNGDIIKIKVTDDRDFSGKEYPTEVARMKQATGVINASPSSGSNADKSKTTMMKDGDVRRKDTHMENYNYIIAWDDENNFRSYPSATSSGTIKSEGYTNAIPAFLPLIKDGEDTSDRSAMDDLSNTTDPHPRTVIAQDGKGDTYFFVSNGRLMGEYGMKTKDVVRVLLSHGMTWAHMLDGGGSTTMVNYGQVINRMSGADSGDRGSTERDARNAIYFGKEDPNETATELLYQVGQATKSIHGHNQFLEGMRYQKNNYIPLYDYFINGWEAYTESGQNTPRAWILPNNTAYFRGVVKAGSDADVDENTEFIQLPDEIPPMFSTHHLVAGDNRGDIYKVIIDQDGKMTWYFWNEEFTSHTYDEIYIRLDGIFIPLNYTSNDDDLNRTQGIQKQWIPYPLERD